MFNCRSFVLLRKTMTCCVLSLGFLMCGNHAVIAQTNGDTGTAALQDSASFKDVQPTSWAYEAIQRLAAQGLLKGYPDGTFKGQRALTRYEMGVVVERLVNNLNDKLVTDGKVDEAALADVQKLLAAYGSEVKDVQRLVDALSGRVTDDEAKITAVTAQVNAVATQTAANTQALNGFHVNFQNTLRTAEFSQNANATNGPTALHYSGGTIAPGASLPVGAGPAPIGIGLLGAVSPAYEGAQNAFYVGALTHGLVYDDFRLNVSGALDTKGTLGYFVQSDLTWTPSATNFQSSSTPTDCLSTTASTIASVSACSGTAYARGNSSMYIKQAFFREITPTGFYGIVGRWLDDEGNYNEITPNLGGYLNGVRLGFNQVYAFPSPWSAYIAYATVDTSLTNQALNNSGCAYPIATCVSGTQNIVQGFLNYRVSSKTQVGATYDYPTNFAGTTWNPAAGLCTANTVAPGTAVTTLNTSIACPTGTHLITNVAGAPVTGAYQTAAQQLPSGSIFVHQFVGPNIHLMGEYLHRFGTDPFTGAAWQGSNQFVAEAQYDSASQLSLPRLGHGTANSNVISAVFVSTGLNAEGVDSGFAATPNQSQQFYPNMSGMQTEWLNYAHWFTPNLRAGIYMEHFQNVPGVYTPAGSLTCPGCYLTQVNANAVGLEVYINSR
jgi:hypothetical protein